MAIQPAFSGHLPNIPRVHQIEGCLRRVCVVLVQTSHPGNVGAAARALRVMGLSDLRLVAPRDPLLHRAPEAVALASGATDVLDQVRVFDRLEEALADVSLAIAASAQGREFAAEPQTPEACASQALQALLGHPEHRVAFVFGSERSGLTIEQAQRCHVLLSIPTDEVYGSLNLAQAVQVVTYCLRRAALAMPGLASGVGQLPGDAESLTGPPRVASVAAVEGLYAHLEAALLAVGYLDPRHPKKLMPRLRRVFARARLEAEEVDLLRGICKKMIQASRRQSS